MLICKLAYKYDNIFTLIYHIFSTQLVTKWALLNYRMDLWISKAYIQYFLLNCLSEQSFIVAISF